jgi:hypothetical protein
MSATEPQDNFFDDINDIEYYLKHTPIKIREHNNNNSLVIINNKQNIE